MYFGAWSLSSSIRQDHACSIRSEKYNEQMQHLVHMILLLPNTWRSHKHLKDVMWDQNSTSYKASTGYDSVFGLKHAIIHT